MTRIRFTLGAMALLSFQAFATAAVAQTCPITEYPCSPVFVTDPKAAVDPLIPIPDPGDDPATRSEPTSSDGGEAEGSEPE